VLQSSIVNTLIGPTPDEMVMGIVRMLRGLECLLARSLAPQHDFRGLQKTHEVEQQCLVLQIGKMILEILQHILL
jgi:hypothetical protein